MFKAFVLTQQRLKQNTLDTGIKIAEEANLLKSVGLIC